MTLYRTNSPAADSELEAPVVPATVGVITYLRYLGNMAGLPVELSHVSGRHLDPLAIPILLYVDECR